ncbi:hypothetical protein [Halomonas sp. TD01]|uniref:hypothetical protein n=1 Tax=Halomonas sp. TD01 TaxID=999141 RepID=UPI000214E0F6|nr:hypothetical protein [Halomonas sp. TD01]EGP18871.1 hypothetical protein GME_14815 [Halomonas sp. TD01]CAH1042107.1 hypothetical protein HPTD01_585 [Halomonas sp. TD01]
MHTVMIICAGLVLVAILAFAARLAPAFRPHYFIVFAVLWLLAACINLWVGVVHAGYSLMYELPFFLIVFLVPIITAYLIKKKYL